MTPVASDPCGDVGLGIHEDATRHTDDAFVRAAPGGGRQERLGRIGHVDADDGKIAILQLPNIRAIFQRGCPLAVGMRIRADSAEEVHGV